MFMLSSDRSLTPSHRLRQTQHYSPPSAVSQATKGGTPALVSPPLAIQIVVLIRERWPLGKQTRELAHGVISAKIQIVVLLHECWPRGKQMEELAHSIVSTGHTNCGTHSRVSTLKLGGADRDRLVCAEQNGQN